MLTNAEIVAMRETLNASLPSECVIMRSTAGTADGAGGYIGGSVSAAGTVACRISPVAPIVPGSESVIAGQLSMVSPWVISFPASTDIRSGDRITSGDATYEVINPSDVRSWELSRRVYAKVVE